MNRAADDRCVIDHHHEDENGGYEGKAFIKKREWIGGIKVPITSCVNICGRNGNEEASTEHQGEADNCRNSEGAFIDPVKKGLRHQHEKAKGDDFNLESRCADRHCFGVK